MLPVQLFDSGLVPAMGLRCTHASYVLVEEMRYEHVDCVGTMPLGHWPHHLQLQPQLLSASLGAAAFVCYFSDIKQGVFALVVCNG